jgi:hypothetical protein
MTEPTQKEVTFQITLTVTDPAAMRAEALRLWLSRGGTEEDFIDKEREDDKFAETPIGSWLEVLFDWPRSPEFECGFAAHTREVDISEFYQPPSLPKGFDPATSVSGAQIAKLMTVALESDYWCDLEPVLPERFKSLVTNPVWYADPALYETQQPWYFEIPNREYGYYAAKLEAPHQDVVHKIGRADIIMALASLAENRPRRIVEIMNGNTDADLADIFFQMVVFKEYCYYN